MFILYCISGFLFHIVFPYEFASSMSLTLDQLNNRSFWRDLAPYMHVDDSEFCQSIVPFQVQNETIDEFNSLLLQEGYFQTEPADFNPISLANMVMLIDTLQKNNIPLAYAFVYDEFWMIHYMLHNLLQGVLGAGYYRLPDFWTWKVDPKKEERGWTPHRDKNYSTIFESGLPKSISVWIPLTEVTTLNGCMYILPADRDPTYGQIAATLFDEKWASFIDGFRALPAQAGSILVWNQAVWHYGSRSSRRAAAPRYSIAVEFQSRAAEPLNLPLYEAHVIPFLPGRIKLIGKQVLQYQHMYALDNSIASLALESIADTPNMN